MDAIDLPTGPLLPGSQLGADAALQRVLDAANGSPADAAKARRVARDFEAVLLQRLMEEMRRTIPKSEFLETGISDQVDGLFWFYLAQEVADRGGLGLWKELCRHLALAQPDQAVLLPEVEA